MKSACRRTTWASGTISNARLCPSLFPRTLLHRQVGGDDAHPARPSRQHSNFIRIVDGKLGDIKVLDILVLQPGAINIMDRGYLDFPRLYMMDQAQARSAWRDIAIDGVFPFLNAETAFFAAPSAPQEVALARVGPCLEQRLLPKTPPAGFDFIRVA